MAEAMTFRVFVSSTFRDLEAERNHLHEHVYPALRRLCAQHGARFQPIDLRWGVSREASLDQQAMNVCLDEIERCREVTPRPNFIVLLGNRHGWLAPPPQIPAVEFEEIRDRVAERTALELLGDWYRRDDNAVPPHYYLRPRDGAHRQDEVWAEVETRLHAALAAAVAGTDYRNDPKYSASATEQEIRQGALGVSAVEGRAFCFVREIIGDFPDAGMAGGGDPVLDFIDRDQSRLDALKSELRRELPYRTYEAGWDATAQRPSEDHLEELGRDVLEVLSHAILEEVAHPTPPTSPAVQPDRIAADPGLDAEGRAHREFAEKRSRVFVGREDDLAAVAGYLSAAETLPLVIAGAGGSGKSALVAEALRRAQQDHEAAAVVYRFIGATSTSTDVRALLHSLCRELARRTTADEAAVPDDYPDLVADFRSRLTDLGARQPVVVFLDSLDQLSPNLGGRNLIWLPYPLPDGVRVVVSTRPEDTLTPLQKIGSPVHELGSMTAGDGHELLHRWLAEAHRTLQPDQEKAVLERFESSAGNPLYLRLAFEEARRWRSHEPPEALATGVGGIIATNTYERLAREENHGDVLVSHALAYLGASQFGLAEDELLDLLSRDLEVYEWFARGAQHVPPDLRQHANRYQQDRSPAQVTQWLEEIRHSVARRPELLEFLGCVLHLPDGPQLPVVLWSRLAIDLRPYLTERSAEAATLITFFHRELGEVAAARFLAGQSTEYHSRVADYFRPSLQADGRRAWDQAPLRALSELPYHLVGAQRWDDLDATLTDFDFLEAKAARVAVDRRVDKSGAEVVTYNGVRRLQDDFDLAIRALTGGEVADRRRVIVTATDLGAGLVICCPHCGVVHVFDQTCALCGADHDLGKWLGREMGCPNPACQGPLKVNAFTVGGDRRRAAEVPAAEEAAPRPAQRPVGAATLPEPVPELPLASGADRLLREAGKPEARVNEWLLALLRRYGPMAEAISPGLQAGPLATDLVRKIRSGDMGEPLPRANLIGRAARHAQDRNSDRITERDLVATILAAAGYRVEEA